jgi:hypothetical protein
MAYFPSQTEYYEAEVQDPSSGSIGSGIGTALGILGGALVGAMTLGTGIPLVAATATAAAIPAVPAAMGVGAAAALGASIGGSALGGIGGSIGLAAGKEKKMLPVGEAPPQGVAPFSPSQVINSDLAKGVFEYMKYKDTQAQADVFPGPYPDKGLSQPVDTWGGAVG